MRGWEGRGGAAGRVEGSRAGGAGLGLVPEQDPCGGSWGFCCWSAFSLTRGVWVWEHGVTPKVVNKGSSV